MVRRSLWIQVFLVLALVVADSAAFADSPLPAISIPSPTSPKDDNLDATMNLLDQLPAQQRDALVKESQEAQQYCQSNALLGNFYDCGCFSLRILDQRLKKGPDYPFANLIMDSDYSQCVFTPAIAGFGYDRCYQVIYMNKISDEAVKKICGCVGRTMAGNFSRQPVSSAEYTDRLFMDSLSACQRAADFQFQ